MPLRDFRCNGCGKEQERFYSADRWPACDACGAYRLVLQERSDEGLRRARARAVFPFVTTHIDPLGKPMTIESMSHLRQVERDYGVVLSAFANNEHNSVDHIANPPTYRGWERDKQAAERASRPNNRVSVFISR